MSKDLFVIPIYAACVIAWLMAMLPAVLFLAREWATRRDSLFDLMTETVLELYYKRFYPSRQVRPDARRPTFQKDFGNKYGRRWYVPPLILLGILSAAGLWISAATVEAWLGVVNPGKNVFIIPDVAVGAFLGGLTWVIFDQLARFRNRDFTSHNVYNGVFRLLIAVPLGASLAAFGNESLKVAVAFLLGAFPTDALFQIARRIGAKQFGMADDAVNNSNVSELEKLQSVGRETAERLRDVGVSSIAALAWTDPVDLTIRTNLEFDFVVDCISQALFWVYVRDDVQKLYALSLRGAQEVATFIHDLESGDALTRAEAAKTLIESAGKINVSPEAFHQTLLQVSGDPSTRFLVKIWEEAY